jgi:uncharacterized membrane protein
VRVENEQPVLCVTCCAVFSLRLLLLLQMLSLFCVCVCVCVCVFVCFSRSLAMFLLFCSTFDFSPPFSVVYVHD